MSAGKEKGQAFHAAPQRVCVRAGREDGRYDPFFGRVLTCRLEDSADVITIGEEVVFINTFADLGGEDRQESDVRLKSIAFRSADKTMHAEKRLTPETTSFEDTIIARIDQGP